MDKELSPSDYENTWWNLAPNLIRQRVIIEGTTESIVEQETMKAYLIELGRITEMEVINGPFAYSAFDMGFGAYIHWKTSGSHFYSYYTNPPLFTVDIYTCKPFSIPEVVEFTKKYLKAIQIVWMKIKI